MILAIKIVASFLFASDFMLKGFVPFVNYFVSTGFDNPYNFFYNLGQPEAFPYPPAMLYILSVARIFFYPVLIIDWPTVTFAHLFIMRIPILLADIAIYLILCKWLETKEKKVLLYYWASPVLFFINYFHGQLDVIPTALLFISLLFLFAKREATAFIILGLGIVAKTHLLAVLPFYFIYLMINRYPVQKVILYSMLPLGVFFAFAWPYLASSGFTQSVFGTEEANKLFLVFVPYLHNDLRLLLAPAAILILFFNFFSYKKLNKDAFLLILGLLFTMLVLFVPPMPGWFYWSIPFFVYFFAKYKEIPKFSFWFLSIAYMLYFIFSKDAKIFSSFELLNPGFITTVSPFTTLHALGINMDILVNVIFTLLIAALVMNAVWIYRMGVRSNLEYKVTDSPTLIGIGGDSGAGKNTLANLIVQLFGKDNAVCVEGDDAHKWERNHESWEKYTHLNPKSNLLHRDLRQTSELKMGEAIKRQLYDHSSGHFTLPKDVEPSKIVLYTGLHPFYLSKMRKAFDIKIYVDPNEDLRKHWKIMRDKKYRGYSREEVIRQLESREEDSGKYIRPQREFADIIITLMPKGELIEDQEPGLWMRIICDNSLHVDPFVEQLSSCGTVDVRHRYEDDLHRQCIEFDGRISAEEINQLAHGLIPYFEELTDGKHKWAEDLDGIRQLFILYYFSELRKSNQTYNA